MRPETAMWKRIKINDAGLRGQKMSYGFDISIKELEEYQQSEMLEKFYTKKINIAINLYQVQKFRRRSW